MWRHVSKDRFIFWNKGGLGWSIGKKAYLTSGSHWHRSGLDSPEPWQGDWEEGVSVTCLASQCSWSPYSPWSPCSTTCGEGLQARSRHLLHPTSQCQDQSEEFRQDFSTWCRDQGSEIGARKTLLCHKYTAKAKKFPY